MTADAPPLVATEPARDDADGLRPIEDRVLWLATAMVDYANRVRVNPTGLKVGGHQASSASFVSVMTTLWFRHLRDEDRVSVKPHAAPVLHAINYLLGELDEAYLTTLRAFGGLQSDPSRTKDPDRVDYSTGSVGIGATAPVWGAVARRYVDSHFGAAGTGRQYSLLGDAELDEGACWEAVLDPAVADLAELVWIVDLNRQSLDRIAPYLAASRLESMFAAAGWHVLTVKYGRTLEALYARPGGSALRRRVDSMPNSEYQRLLRCNPDELRERLPGGDPDAAAIHAALDGVPGRVVHEAFRDLGGHDLRALDVAFSAIDDTRPTVILAYTVKGHRLATEGHRQNHSSLLTETQVIALAARLGADRPTGGTGLPPGQLKPPWARRPRSGYGGRRRSPHRLRRSRQTWAARPRAWAPPRRRSAGRCSICIGSRLRSVPASSRPVPTSARARTSPAG